MEYEEKLESLKTKSSDLTTQINNLNSKVESLKKTNKILENNLKEERNKEKEEYSDEIIDNYIKGLRRNIEYLEDQRDVLEKELLEVLGRTYQGRIDKKNYEEIIKRFLK